MSHRSDHPVAPDQLALAKLVLRCRREMALSQGEVAKLMRKAALAAGDPHCVATRQSVSEYEHGRIPRPYSLRLLAAALGVSPEEAQMAAVRQQAHREMARAAGSILGVAEGGSPADLPAAETGAPGANRQATGGAPPTRIVVVSSPHVGQPCLADGNDAGPTARPWQIGDEERLILGLADGPAVRGTGDNADVNRRQFLIDLGVLGVAGPLAAGEVVRQGLTAALAGGGHVVDIDEWERIVHEYAHSFNVNAPDLLLRNLTADLAVLQFGLGAADIASKGALARAGGQLAAICAMAWRNAGDPQHAARWWRTACQLADSSGDAEVRTWVRGLEVLSGLYEERPVSVILDRTTEATSIAGPLAGAGSAWLHCGLAQTLAVAGRGDEALAALGRVADVTDRLPAHVVADDSVLGWQEVRLRHTESYVYTWLGDSPRAYAAQEAALRIYPESLVRDRAMMLLHRGACMIRDGDVGGGLAHTGRVLDDLPVQHHTESVYATGRAVMRVLPAQERGRPDATELGARLTFSPA